MASQRSEFPAASDSRSFADLCSQAFHTTSRLGDVCCSALADWRKFCRRKTTAKSKCATGRGAQALEPSTTALSRCSALFWLPVFPDLLILPPTFLQLIPKTQIRPFFTPMDLFHLLATYVQCLRSCFYPSAATKMA